MPFVLVDRERGGLQIVALNPASARQNLSIGMSLADARAWMPGLKVAETDLAADARLLRDLAESCESCTPLVALDGPDGLCLDITGCAHLFGGEDGLRTHLCDRLGRMGLTASATIAGTPQAARAFVRFTTARIVPPKTEAQAARALPVEALEQDAETTLALARAGLKRLGDLADRPAHMLTARFGPRLITALRRIMGQEDTRLTPLRSPPDCQASRIFAEPMLEMAAIEGVLADLAERVCAQLTERGLGGRRFEASFFRTDGTVRRIAIDMAASCRDAAPVLRLMRLRIESLADPIDPGFGFDAFRLAVLRAEPLGARQISLDGEQQAQGDVTALVDRLVARFGRDRVLRFVARDTHDPRRSAARVAVASTATSARWPRPVPSDPPARPLTLFTPPQLIETVAEVPDGPPMRFRWRRVLHDVARAEGPERIAPEWWLAGNEAPATRDYYRIEDGQGRRFWVFREGFFEDQTARPRWFLHGLFA